MGRRRRNLLILLFMVGLTAASAIVIASKPTVLGLDLRGGTQLIYQGEETARTPNIGSEEIDRAIEIIRERADKLGVSEPEISRLGEKGIQVGLPNVQNAEQAIEQIGTTSQLYFYDFEANVVPPPRGAEGSGEAADPSNPNIYTFPNLYDAVQFASKRKPECFQDQCTTAGPTHYLFDRDSHQLLAGPAAQQQDLFLQFRKEKQPPGSQIISVPQGTVVVQAESEDPTLSQSLERDLGHSALRAPGSPGAVRRRHQEPRAAVRSQHQPAQRHVRLHRRGAGRVPGRHPNDRPARGCQRPARRGGRGRRPVLAALLGGAGRPGGHPADHQLLREPGWDRRAHRSADLGQLHDQLGAGPGRVPAHRGAADQPPAGEPEHGVGNARPAGARPGAAGRDRRPDPGRLLPDRLLPTVGGDLRPSAWPSTG